MSYRLISVSLLSAAAVLLSAGPVLGADAPAAAAKASAPKAAASKAAAPQAAASQLAEPAKPAKPARPAKPPKTPPVPAKQLVDINTAKADELKKLPGIGDEEAAKIIAGRPYGSKSWLKTKNILPDEQYQTIRDLVAAKDAAKHLAKKKAK